VSPIEGVVLLLVAGIGLRWSALSLPAWLASIAWIALVGSIGTCVLWGLLIYPMALLVASRRGRISARYDAFRHLRNNPNRESENELQQRRIWENWFGPGSH
jgi:hypothetical protein